MSHRAFVPPTTTRLFGPGQVCLDAPAGAVVLVRHPTNAGRGIRFFERLRKPRGMSWRTWWRFCWCNHACVTLTGGPNAQVVQATAKGLVLTPLAELGAQWYAVIEFHVDAAQLAAGTQFAQWSEGLGYAWGQIVADVLNAATGLELCLGIGDRMVCSTATARTAERYGLIPDRAPGAVTPAHLSWYAGVMLPASQPVKLSVMEPCNR